MSLAPAPPDHERRVAGVESEVHGAVGGVHVADLAAGAAGGVQRLKGAGRVHVRAAGGEVEGEAVFLEA